MRKLLALAGAGILLVGCGSKTVYVTETTKPVTTLPITTTTQSYTDEDIYLSVIKGEFPQLSVMGDSYLLELGYTMCGAIDEGMTLVDLALAVLDMGLDEYMIGYIGGAAIEAFCPWNRGFFSY